MEPLLASPVLSTLGTAEVLLACDQHQVDELLERLFSLRAPRPTLRESSRQGRAAGRARDRGRG